MIGAVHQMSGWGVGKAREVCFCDDRICVSDLDVSVD